MEAYLHTVFESIECIMKTEGVALVEIFEAVRSSVAHGQREGAAVNVQVPAPLHLQTDINIRHPPKAASGWAELFRNAVQLFTNSGHGVRGTCKQPKANSNVMLVAQYFSMSN